MSESSKPTTTHVRLSFGRPLTDADLKAIQAKTDALEVSILPQGGHHHDHDSHLILGDHHIGDKI
jgi:hypothetical protein